MAKPDDLILSDVYLSNHSQISTFNRHLQSTISVQSSLYDETLTRFAYRGKNDGYTQEDEEETVCTIIGQFNENTKSDGGIQFKRRKQSVRHDIQEDRDHRAGSNFDASIDTSDNILVDGNIQTKVKQRCDGHTQDAKDNCTSTTTCKLNVDIDNNANTQWEVRKRSNQTSCSGLNVTFDSDGDIQLTRRKRKRHNFTRSILIRHCMATRLQDVGLQVWRGALLMCDFIIHNAQLFQDCYCLELGAGVGLTSLIIASYAKRIYATDIGHDLLRTCYLNIQLNDHLYINRSINDIARVRQLNWLHGIPKCDTNKSELQSPFSWQHQDVLELLDCVDTIVACDVIYDDQQTDALLTLIKDILALNSHNKMNTTVYITMEKRINFTLSDLEETAPAYNHFLATLNTLIQDNNLAAQPIAIDFPQYFQYERVQQLEMWKVTLQRQS